MKARNIISGILLLFVAASVVYLVVRESGQSAAVSENTQQIATAEADVMPADRVLAYYFYGGQRCPTCRKIEAYTQEAIQTGFAADLAAGRLQWQAVNVDEPVNEHFVADFELTAKSVVLVSIQNGEQAGWKNLDQVWDLTSDKEKFVTYITKETRAQLEQTN
jgi:hypothetical protein